MPNLPLARLPELVGNCVGASSWMTIDQERIDRFADVTEDWQFIHVDPSRAKRTPFGGTVAHGFLTLSLLSKFAYEVGLEPEGATMSVNYGFDRIRNLAPVVSGARVRGMFHLKSFDFRTPERLLLTYQVRVEIEREEKPALIADWLSLHQLGGDHAIAPRTMETLHENSI